VTAGAMSPAWRPSGPVEAPGSGLAVVVNANAKRGGRRVAVQIARALPGASVRLTRSKEEITTWLRVLPPRVGVFAAGGDGTAMALVNALARVTPADAPLPTMGVLPLGTGNAWAHALGAPKLHRCLELLARTPGSLPTQRSGLVEVEGTLTHFAGSGWDAMILDDFRRQVAAAKGPGRRITKSVYGYVSATFLHTIPRVARFGNPRVLVENLDDEVYVLGPGGRPERLNVGRGAILYDGPAGVAAVGTCPEFGYRFRAFPFAERMPGLMSVRIFDRGALGAMTSIPWLWAGTHPLRGMHDWLARHVRMTFSRPVQLQIGGDACGERRTVEYRASPRPVSMVDWRRMD
jgi:diacylglycerol kinase family enzyme